MSIARGIVTIDNCLFTGNRAGTASGGSNSVGALTLYQTPATVTNTTFSNNSSGAPPTATTTGVNGSVGAIHAEGADMVFRRVTITGNKAHGDVGGIYMRSGGSSTLTVIDSTISNNESATTFGAGPTSRADGGGVQAAGGPTINIINTTIANNVAGGGAGILNNSTGLNIVNCTIVGNTATDDSTNDGGGGIQNNTGAVTTVQNSIIAGNTAAAGLGPNVKGPVTSGGYNIIGNPSESTGFGAEGDQLNVNPLLDPKGLQDNGGATKTIALRPGSPAIDKGKSANVKTDQRGFLRPFDDPSIPNAAGGDGADIGAYEANALEPKTLGNISTRLRVGTGDNVLIGGFIITGTQPKKVIVRAIGPSLALSGKLANPSLELFGPGGLITSNNNWQESPNKQAIINSQIPPKHPLEAAIVATLPAKNAGYTAIVRGVGGGTGIGLVEVYDLDATVDSELANISSRGLVQTGDNVMIGGFIISGTTPRKVIVRAIGPSLPVPVPGKLADPTLELFDQNGQQIAMNDNWRQTQQAQIRATGVAPTKDREAAIVATLPPGGTTAIVRGKNGTTGVALVEIYALD